MTKAQVFCFHITLILILICDFWVNFGYILSENIAVIWSDIHYVIWKFGKKSKALFWTFIGENKYFLNIFKVFLYEMWPFHLPKGISEKNINILLWKQYFSNHFLRLGHFVTDMSESDILAAKKPDLRETVRKIAFLEKF